MEFVVAIYEVTRRFPRVEVYGLVSQMRRAGVSIPSNIAEGKGRLTDRDRAHFFSQARGSLLELETQIQISLRLGYISAEDANSLLHTSEDVGRSLNSLIRSIRPATNSPAASVRVCGLKSEV